MTAVTVSTATALTMAGVCSPAWASPRQGSSTTGKTAVTGSGLSDSGIARKTGKALAKAKATGKGVVIDELTTSTSWTTVDPSGHLTLTQTSEPTRMREGGKWVNLDATLRANRDSTLSPKVSSASLKLSGGGNGPLVTLSTQGRKLVFTWPTVLPKPTVSGDTATYPAVLPDVDLLVTANSQGGFRDVLVVKSRSAANDPRLAKLTLAVHTTGLVVGIDGEGNLTARTSAKGGVVYSAIAPRMWDSATANTAKTSTSQPAAPSPNTDGRLVSTSKRPGRLAHTSVVKLTARGNAASTSVHATTTKVGGQDGTLTLTPDHALLANPATVFPVYIDPSVGPGAVHTIGVTDNVGNATDDLPVGYENWSGPTFKARSFVNVTIDPVLWGAKILGSSIQFPYTENSETGCATANTDLWWTVAIPSSPDWNWAYSGSTWLNGGPIASAPTGWGTGCSATQKLGAGFNIAGFMSSKATVWGTSNMTFGLRAEEIDANGWREFSKSFTMTTSYDRQPLLPQYPGTSPGGACTTDATRTIIGLDDLTLETVPSDPDGDYLTTQFVIKVGGSKVYDTGDGTGGAPASPGGATGGVVQLPISRTLLAKWAPNGGQFQWYTQAKDPIGLTSPTAPGDLGSSQSPCAFTYDPSAPPAPTVQIPSNAGLLGATATASISPCSSCTSSTATRYGYQVNDGPPTIVARDTSNTTTKVSIPLTQIGLGKITVVAFSASGNPSPAGYADFAVQNPASPYPDGDFTGAQAGNGNGIPDLLAVGSDKTNPGLWLAISNGTGTLNPPTDIGGSGTGINSTPADWAGSQITHGDFTQRGVQDVIAYYPPGSTYAGQIKLLFGTGSTHQLNSYTGQASLSAGTLADANGNNPMQLVAAGNASLTSTGMPDLIGITGDAGNGYQLNLYTSTTGFVGYHGYDYNNPTSSKFTVLAGPGDASNLAPDGASDWNNFMLATARPGNDPSKTVLFALNKQTGKLWESVNTTGTTGTRIGTGYVNASNPGTWTPITSTFTASTIPGQISADVNANGTIELWAVTGQSASSYTLSGTTLTPEQSKTLLAPTHEWPLTDGGTTLQPADTGGSTTATLSGGAGWISNDPARGTVADFQGPKQPGYITLPSGLFQNSSNAALQSMTVSLSFKANAGSTGILLSTGVSNPDTTPPSNSAVPIMYIGTDGKLYAQFWTGQITPLISPGRVTDGQWHTATLVADGPNADQLLYLDNNVPIHIVNNGQVTSPAPTILNPATTNTAYNVYAGAGIFNTLSWPNADATGGASGTTRPSFFKGELSDIAFYTQTLSITPSMNQLKPRNIPLSMTGTFVSGMNSSFCLDDYNNATTPSNKIDINTCNGQTGQTWTLNSNNTITLTSAGGTGAAGSGLCLDVSGNGITPGTKLDLYPCAGTANEQWWVLSDGEIANPQSGDCIDDPGSSTTAGTQLDIWGCIGSSNEVWLNPAHPAVPQRIGAIVSAVPSNLCVDDWQGSTTNSNKIDIYTCNGGSAQTWTIQPNGTITGPGGKCLDIAGQGTTNNTPVDLYSCVGTPNQQWQTDTDGTLWNPHSDKCLDDPGGSTAPGTQLDIYDCIGNPNEAWTTP